MLFHSGERQVSHVDDKARMTERQNQVSSCFTNIRYPESNMEQWTMIIVMATEKWSKIDMEPGLRKP